MTVHQIILFAQLTLEVFATGGRNPAFCSGRAELVGCARFTERAADDTIVLAGDLEVVNFVAATRPMG